MLQKFLKEKVRIKIVNDLFKKFVTSDYENFYKELYLTNKEMSEMSSFKMHFGSHSHSHQWMNKLSKKEQYLEIIKSINILKKIMIKIILHHLHFLMGAIIKTH